MEHTAVNFMFLGGTVNFSHPISFTSRGFPVGSIVQVKYNNGDISIKGKVAIRRATLGGHEEILLCQYQPDLFHKILNSPLRPCVDVMHLQAMDDNRNTEVLVMTFSPIESTTENFPCVKHLTLGQGDGAVELSNANMPSCTHSKTKVLKPDPCFEFFERTYVLCENCGAVISKRGSCARDACPCLHSFESDGTIIHM